MVNVAMSVPLESGQAEGVLHKLRFKLTLYFSFLAMFLIKIGIWGGQGYISGPNSHPKISEIKKVSRCLFMKWVFQKIGGKTPKSSILIGFSIIFTIHFGVPVFWETPKCSNNIQIHTTPLASMTSNVPPLQCFI